MSKTLFNLIVVVITAILPISYVHANITQSKEPRTYVIRVTSNDQSQPQIKINGAILQSTNFKDSTVTEVHATTPWETTVTAEYIRYMLRTDLKNPMINIELLEKSNGGEQKVGASGTGHTFDGSQTIYDTTYGIIVLN